MSISTVLVDDVYAALSETEGRKPVEIRHRVGRGAVRTIRLALMELVDDGRADFDGHDGSRLYRRATS